MRRLLVVLPLALGLLALPSAARATTNALADEHKLGLGVGGGSLSSGLSAKAFLGPSLSAQAILGYWFGWGLNANVDVLAEMPQLWSNDVLGLNWNVGAGAGVVLGSPVVVGVDGVAGLSLQLLKFPVEITAEIRPTFLLGSSVLSGFYFGSGGSVRYFF